MSRCQRSSRACHPSCRTACRSVPPCYPPPVARFTRGKGATMRVAPGAWWIAVAICACNGQVDEDSIESSGGSAGALGSGGAQGSGASAGSGGLGGSAGAGGHGGSANSGGSAGSCVPGYADCDANASNGCESNIWDDWQNCGDCGRTCETPNAVPTCNDGLCRILQCDAGFSDCNGASDDGCETQTTSCREYCGPPSPQQPFAGSCADGCPPGTVCVVETGGVAGGGGEYCATIPASCNGVPTCTCMANCVCTNTEGSRPETCSEHQGRELPSTVIACFNGLI
jgi:hypothetical protein